MPLFTFDILEFGFIISLLIVLPTFIDGLIQLIFEWESNNWLRFITGVISGVGMMSLASIVGKFIANYIISIFH